MIKQTKLYTVDSKGKYRVFIIEIVKTDVGYEIHRRSGLLTGKKTEQPVITIIEGKVKRTPLEQAVLEFDSKIKVQKDRKGYKTLEDLGIESESEISALGTKKTSATGYQLPAGAIDFTKDKKREEKIKKGWYESLKLDGVRTLAHLVKDDKGNDKLDFVSRGGLLYQGVAKKFEYDPGLIAIAKQFNCQIDGEFYCHGMPLKDINGVCQLLEYNAVRHDPIEFWVFDIADDHRPFIKRLAILQNEVTKYVAENPQILVVSHKFVDSLNELEKSHDDAVANGFEGLILRDENALYQYGKKNSSMMKEKRFQDDEFEVIGYKEGLRPVEDMCFVLKTHEGKTFEAKPMGDYTTKASYIENMGRLIGKFGTVKFFYYTPDGIPYLPSFKSFRPMKDGKVLI